MIAKVFDLPFDGPYTRVVVFITWCVMTTLFLTFLNLLFELLWHNRKFQLLKDIQSETYLIKEFLEQSMKIRGEAREISERTSDRVEKKADEIKETVVAKVEEIKEEIKQQSTDSSNLPQK